MALSGNFHNYVTSQFGLYCEWRGEPSPRENITKVTVNAYLRYYNIAVGQRDGVITIDGNQKAFTSDEINDINASTWTNVLIGTYMIEVPHNTNGTRKNIPLSVSWNFDGVYSGISIDKINASISIDLDDIETYKLSLSAGTDSFITVLRTSSGAGNTGLIENDAILYYGDRLKITFDVSDGYRIGTHTVNNSTFTSGGTIIVDGDISVISSADVIIKQAFAPENMQCFDTKGNTLKTLYQWDKNVAIVIKDVATSPPPIFQFANRLINETISVASFISGKDLIVTIPNALLESPESIFAFIYQNSGSKSKKTLGAIYIPVVARKKPADEIYNEQEVK